jgi:hypothetical protein
MMMRKWTWGETENHGWGQRIVHSQETSDLVKVLLDAQHKIEDCTDYILEGMENGQFDSTEVQEEKEHRADICERINRIVDGLNKLERGTDV